MLFATESLGDGVVVPSYFWTMLVALAIVNMVAAVCFVAGWRLIDWITPGDLNLELAPPRDPGQRTPNQPLAIVVSAMIIGWCMIQVATIIGVLLH